MSVRPSVRPKAFALIHYISWRNWARITKFGVQLHPKIRNTIWEYSDLDLWPWVNIDLLCPFTNFPNLDTLKIFQSWPNLTCTFIHVTLPYSWRIRALCPAIGPSVPQKAYIIIHTISWRTWAIVTKFSVQFLTRAINRNWESSDLVNFIIIVIFGIRCVHCS